MPKPDLQKVPPFYHNYIGFVKEENLSEAFNQHETEMLSFLQEIPEDKWDYRYAEGKWSIKEMVQHLIDSERIFCYRALCIARKETQSLPGFDENAYAAASKADRRKKHDLLQELNLVQASSTLLFRSFDDEQLQSEGIANNKPISVNAIGFIMIGHVLHHKNILQERYL